MKIFLSGYGRMGKEVEKQSLSRNHEIIGFANNPNDWNRADEFYNQIDVVIDFSLPDTAIDVIKTCFKKNVPIVTGTTGWYEALPEIKALCKQQSQTLLYAPNFSIGVNLFFEVSRYLAKMMDQQENYKAHIFEEHHIHKLDAPSGTAKMLADDLIENISRYSGWSEKGDTQTLPVASSRQGEVPGTHEVIYNSDVDTITIRHEAKSRQGFALGAVKAAEWVMDKKGVYTMKDFLFNNF